MDQSEYKVESCASASASASASARASRVCARVHDADVVQVRHEQLEHRVRAAQRAPHGQVHALGHQVRVCEVQHQLLVARVRHVEPLLRLEPAAVHVHGYMGACIVLMYNVQSMMYIVECSSRCTLQAQAQAQQPSHRIALSSNGIPQSGSGSNNASHYGLHVALKCVLLLLLLLYQTFGGSVGRNTGFCS